jgi:hypothetical protein
MDGKSRNSFVTLIAVIVFGVVWFAMYPRVVAFAAREQAQAQELPPQIPAAFWGYVDGGQAGQSLNVSVGGVVVVRSQVFDWQGQAVYSVDVPMDGVSDGEIARFKVAGLEVGQAKLHSGKSTQLDLKYQAEKMAEPDPYLPPEPESCDWVWYLLGLCE